MNMAALAFGQQVRLRRLYRRQTGRLLLVPLDHTLTSGPIARDGLDPLVEQLAESGVDAVVLHKGNLRWLRPDRFDGMGLVVHLNAGTLRAPDPDARTLVCGVAEAVRLGADAVSLHTNLGAADEKEQLTALAAVGRACQRWQVPLLAMMYARGPRIGDPRDPELIAHAVQVGVDLGADVVKTAAPRRMRDLTAIARACPVPVVVGAGIPDADLLGTVADAMRYGAGGVAVGRGVFTDIDPGAVARKLSDLVHAHYEPGVTAVGAGIAGREIIDRRIHATGGPTPESVRQRQVRNEFQELLDSSSFRSNGARKLRRDVSAEEASIVIALANAIQTEQSRELRRSVAGRPAETPAEKHLVETHTSTSSDIDLGPRGAAPQMLPIAASDLEEGGQLANGSTSSHVSPSE
jgi:2-amino-4,5-dihydroxy-6-oxo-7-(phosphonooxy)heptanoate synthase